MPNETTSTAYAMVLEELAQSRGLSGAEELVERAADAEELEDYSAQALLEEPPAGFGPVLDRVLDPPLSEPERLLLMKAFVETFWRR